MRGRQRRSTRCRLFDMLGLSRINRNDGQLLDVLPLPVNPSVRIIH